MTRLSTLVLKRNLTLIWWHTLWMLKHHSDLLAGCWQKHTPVYWAGTAAPLQRDLGTVHSKQVALSNARHQNVIREKEAGYFNIRVYSPHHPRYHHTPSWVPLSSYRKGNMRRRSEQCTIRWFVRSNKECVLPLCSSLQTTWPLLPKCSMEDRQQASARNSSNHACSTTRGWICLGFARLQLATICLQTLDKLLFLLFSIVCLLHSTPE